MLIPADSGEPELSVVMVAHGAWSLTERAIAALIANTEDRRFELIMVDNCSEDETTAHLRSYPDIRVIIRTTATSASGPPQTKAPPTHEPSICCC